ncbi:MAG: cyclopropane-fatty-acyl-phospholipid synthase family protein [Rhodospirillaceae bacterium]|nr:cyclopropane-fatty-acyl-phospholipid synthase family protein [Rhodospirillaceae bacterium]
MGEPVRSVVANAGEPAHRRGNILIQKFLSVVSRLTAGRLTLVMPDGTEYELSSNTEAGPHAVIHVRNWRALRRFMAQGDFGFVEAYLDGDWDSPELSDVIELAALNMDSWNAGAMQNLFHKIRHRIGHLLRPNTRRGARKNIAAHYDLGNDFYAQWLDPTMTYSSAYFTESNQPLPDAQIEKYRRIAAMLDLKPEHHLLEVGFGWGGFAEYAVKTYGCRVTGLTLSQEQLKYASARLQKAGLSDKVDFRLQDYRDTGGSFDRIASIEMFEAVGEEHWPRYFNMIRERLVAGGSAALQIITIDEKRFDSYRKGADFIQRYIFPGGMLPSVTALKSQVQAAKLNLADATMFGPSYAQTLRIWRDRFLDKWHAIQPLGFDDRFRRMWEMYLAYCEGGFRARSIDVGQFKVVRS